MSREPDLETKMFEEIRARIDLYNDPYYKFAPSINKHDFIAMIICGIICIIGLIWGVI